MAEGDAEKFAADIIMGMVTKKNEEPASPNEKYDDASRAKMSMLMTKLVTECIRVNYPIENLLNSLRDTYNFAVKRS
jgi:hypothetical protein